VGGARLPSGPADATGHAALVPTFTLEQRRCNPLAPPDVLGRRPATYCPEQPRDEMQRPAWVAGRAPSAAAPPGVPSQTWAARDSMPPARSRTARERPDLAARSVSLSKMTRRRKVVFGAAGAVVVLLLLVVAVKRNSGQSVAVQVGEVTRQTLTSVVTA